MRSYIKSSIGILLLIGVLFVNTFAITMAMPEGYVVQEYPVYVSASPLKFDEDNNPWFISNNEFNKFSLSDGAVSDTYAIPLGTIESEPSFSIVGDSIWYAFTGDDDWLTVVNYDYGAGEYVSYTYNSSISSACYADNLYIDAAGRILVYAHTYSTVIQTYFIVFDPSDESFTIYTLPETLPASGVPLSTQDHDGNIWVNGPGSSIYMIDGDYAFTKYTLTSQSKVMPRVIAADSDDNIWVGVMNTHLYTDYTTVLQLSPDGEVSNTAVNAELVNLLVSNDEYLWAGWDNILNIYDSTGATLVESLELDYALSYLGLAPDGSLWGYAMVDPIEGEGPTYMFYHFCELEEGEIYTEADLSGTTGANGWYNSAVVINFTTTGDDIAEIHYILDNGEEQTLAGNTGSFTVDTEGIHNISYYAVTGSGTEEEVKNLELKIDWTAPEVAITYPADGDTIHIDGDEIEPTYEATDNLTPEDDLNVYIEPVIIDEDTSEGPLTIFVIVTDEAGNEAEATIEVTIVGDSAPVTDISYEGDQNDLGWFIGPITTTIYSSEGYATEIHYSVDGGEEIVVESSEAIFTIEDEGLHTIIYHGVSYDLEEEAKTATVGLDWTAPTVEITSPIDGKNLLTNSTIDLQYIAGDNVDEDLTIVVEPSSFPSPLPEGEYTITVTVTDDAGYTASDSVTVTILSIEVPTTSIALSGTEGANGWYTSEVTATLASEGDTFAALHYSVDGGAYTTVTSPTATITISTEGVHTITYYSTSIANLTESVQNTTISVDWTAPTVTITSPTEDQILFPDSDVELEYTATDNIDDNLTITVDPSSFPNPLDIGDLTVTVTATDEAGNTATESVTATVYSTIVPVTGITLSGTEGDNDWYTSNVVVTLRAVGDTFSTLYYRLDDGALHEVTSDEVTFTVSTEGEHTVIYYSASIAGLEEDEQTTEFKIDKTAPVIAITSPTEGQILYPDSDIDIEYTVTDNFDDDPTITVDPESFPSPLDLGDLTITITATDEAGNTATETVTVTVIEESTEDTPRELKEGARDLLLASKTGIHEFDNTIDYVVNLIDESLTPKYWIDDTHLSDKWGIKVYIYEGLASNTLENYISLYEKQITTLEKLIQVKERLHKDTTDLKAQVAAMKSLIPVFEEADAMLAKADEGLAKTALDEASALTPPTAYKTSYKNLIKKAKAAYEDGLEYEEDGDYTKAIHMFKLSWIYSRQATHVQQGDSHWGYGYDWSSYRNWSSDYDWSCYYSCDWYNGYNWGNGKNYHSDYDWDWGYNCNYGYNGSGNNYSDDNSNNGKCK